MLVPKSALLFEQKLNEVLAKLPADVPLKVYTFNIMAYQKWLGSQKDTQQKRARWAALQGDG